MPVLERHAEMPVLVFDHPTLGQCSAYPIGCSHEWLLLVSSPPSPPRISSSSISQPWHTCSMPTLVYPGGICCPWYTSPGWVGMAVPYATVNIKFLMAVRRITRCPLGDLIHWKSLRGRRFNCGLDPHWLDGDVCGSAAAFPLRQMIGYDIRLWRHCLRLLLLAHCYGHLALNLFLQSLIM